MAARPPANRPRRPWERRHEDAYYDRPAFSHGAWAAGASKRGAEYLPRALWAPNRLVADKEAARVRAHHVARVHGSRPAVDSGRRSVSADRVRARSAPLHAPLKSVRVSVASEGVAGPHVLCIDGVAGRTIHVRRGGALRLDLSDPSNALAMQRGVVTLRLYEAGGASAGEPAQVTRGVHRSDVPPGATGAAVVLQALAELPSTLHFVGESADGERVHGGTIRIYDRSRTPRNRSSPPRPPPRRTAARHPDTADALAEHEARTRRSARLLAAREVRAATVGLEARKLAWNSRPREAPPPWALGAGEGAAHLILAREIASDPPAQPSSHARAGRGGDANSTRAVRAASHGRSVRQRAAVASSPRHATARAITRRAARRSS